MMHDVSLAQIVVGVDFSESSLEASKMALHLARAQGAKVTFVHVGYVPELPNGIPTTLSKTADEYVRIAKASLDQDRSKLNDWFERFNGQGVEIQLMVVEGNPAEAVAKVATSLKADLICAGSNNRTGVMRFALGSVSESLVRIAECDVLVVREGDEGRGGFDSLIVGMDFSESAKRALNTALTLASKNAKVEMVHCFDSPAIGNGMPGLDSDSFEKLGDAVTVAMKEKGQELLDSLDTKDLNVTFEVHDSAPKNGLHELANERKSDVLVVASRGESGLKRMLLGSVSEASVRHANCSVLVCNSK